MNFMKNGIIKGLILDRIDTVKSHFEAGKTYVIFDQTGEGRLAIGGQTFNGETGFAVYVE